LKKRKKFKKSIDKYFSLWYNIRGLIKNLFLEDNKMSTFMQKKEAVVRKWYVIDAAGKPLGRTAVVAADLLRGKNAPEFTPHVDCGNFVIIVNAGKAVLTGKKLEQKYYQRHSGYIGGLKSIQYKKIMAEKPEFAMETAVKGMLPKNSLGRTAATRLKVYAGEAHNHAAQKPETYEF
jgi:large subunit ribosomal protein L13